VNRLVLSCLSALLCLSTPLLYSQQDPTLVTGLVPYQSYHGGKIDSINLSNGSLTFQIPLIDYPQVGGKLKLAFGFVWNGKVDVNQPYCTPDDNMGDETCYAWWTPIVPGEGSVTSPPSSSGMEFIDLQDITGTSYRITHAGLSGAQNLYYNVTVFRTPDGSIHPAVDVAPGQSIPTGQRSVDGTNLYNGNPQDTRNTCTFQNCIEVLGPDGMAYYPQGFSFTSNDTFTLRQDTNGNKIQYSNDSSFQIAPYGDGIYTWLAAGSYTDTVNRTIPSVPAPSTSADSTGCTGPLPIYSTSIWKIPGVSTSTSATLTYKFCYVQTPVSISVDLDHQNPISGTTLVLQSIVLPNNQTWQFEYNVHPDNDPIDGDVFTEISKITFPTGGTTSYHYKLFTDSGNTTSLYVSSRTENDQSGSGDRTWNYNYIQGSNDTTTVTDPLGNQTVHTLTPLGGAGPTYETKTQYYFAVDQSIHKTVDTSYQYVNATEDGTGSLFNAFPASITTTLDGSSTTETLSYCLPGVTNCSFNFDEPSSNIVFSGTASYGKVMEDKVVDYSGAILKDTVTNYQFQAANSTAYQTANLIDLVSSTTVSDTQKRAMTTYNYDESPSPQGAFGNLTSTSKWLNTGGTVSNSTIFNPQGMPTLFTDPNGHKTSISSYQCSGLFPTQIIEPYQSATTVAETTTYVYDCPSGKLISITDPNGQLTQYIYDDPLNRLKQIKQAVKTSSESWATYSYPNANQVNLALDKDAAGDGAITSSAIVDGFGRTIHQNLANGSMIDTTYDSIGRVSSVSNPYFSPSAPSDPPPGTTSYAYDGLDRKRMQCQPDNVSSNPTVCDPTAKNTSYLEWSYSGNVTTFYDELRNSWQRSSDALGRLNDVIEPGNLKTHYSYDALGNLWGVTQTGLSSETPQTRSFTYDSLSRLVCASNPENSQNACPSSATSTMPTGVVTYGYDPNGNVSKKTDARGIALNYTYDALNRVQSEASTDGSISRNYSYDNTSYSSGIGRLFGTFVGSSAGTGYYYDAMGRVIGQSYDRPSMNGGWQQAFNITYDLAGNMTSFSYPDGRVVKQTWDSAGHLQTVTYDNWNGQATSAPTYQSYLTAATYFPDGSPQTMTFGNGVTETYNKNNRLQPTESIVQPGAHGLTQKVFDKLYCYGAATPGCANYNVANNGNIWGINDPLNTGRYQGFLYDNLNRLTSFGTGDRSISQAYSYDSFGNMSQVSPGTYQTNLSFGPNNQINSAGYAYDPAGNLTQLNFGAGIYQYLAYDAENQLVNVNHGAATYTYDAEGHRARKDMGTGGTDWTEYVHFNGQPMAEKNADGTWSDYIYANGRMIARADAFEYRLHIHGQMLAAGNSANWDLPNPNYTIGSGDKLCWRQYQVGSIGGMRILFTDNSYSSNYPGDNLLDEDGMTSNFDTTQNSWHQRVADMSSYAGKTISAIWVNAENQTPVGTWDSYFADIVILSADGTVHPLYTGQSSVGLSYFSTSTTNVINTYAEVQNVSPQNTSGWVPNQQAFYHGDQIGSARLITAYGGWPLSAETYYPFGLEATPNADPNHYKFTGKERDTESGLDYFGARYLSSSMGRFMSPDPSNQGVDFWLPQTWNRYAYVLNNPLSMVDKNGLWPTRVHENIIDNAFPGLSKGQRDMLKTASKDVDSYQGQGASIYHNMRDPDAVAGLSDMTSEDVIDANEANAKQLQADWIAQGHTGLSPAALNMFGNALHTITDGYSPSHEGGQFWCGMAIHCWPGDAWHFVQEAWPSSANKQRQQNAAQAGRRAFIFVFGDDAGTQATHEKVTVTIEYDTVKPVEENP